jgi:hypothetical protein
MATTLIIATNATPTRRIVAHIAPASLRFRSYDGVFQHLPA